LFVVLSPPTPRIQTPPPCESGGGLAGALTNALLCVRKAVFAAFIVAAIAVADEIAPPNRIFWSKPSDGSFSSPQLCACALEDAKPAKMRTATNASRLRGLMTEPTGITPLKQVWSYFCC